MTHLVRLTMMTLICTATAAAGENADVTTAAASLRSGDYGAARKAFKALIAEKPSDAAAHVGLIRTLLETGAHDEAAKAAGDAAAKLPGNAAVLCARAEVMAARGSYAQQRKTLEAALKAEPDSIEATVRLGILEGSFGREKERDKVLEPIEDLLFEGKITRPRDKWLAGQALECLNLPHDALRLFAEVQKADKTFVEAFISAGDLFFAKQQVGDAWREYRAALKINGNSPGAHIGCGACYFYNSRYAEAEQECRAALKVNPSLVDAYELLAVIDLVSERYEQAHGNLQAALKVNPNDLSARAHLAAVYLLENKTERFERECMDILAVNPRYSDVYELAAQACSFKRREGEAERLYQKALAINPKSDVALAGLGMIHLRNARYKTARELLEKAFKLNRFNVRVYNTLELCDKMKEYATHTSDGFVLRLDDKNDPVLAEYVLAEMAKIREEVGGRYKFHPTEPVHIEIFPSRRWFGARVAGLPHIGLIGAFLGKVIVMTSPKVKPGELNWRIILAHEYTHAVNLQYTRMRCWHWFTEGCAVSQEQSPRRHEWNQLIVRADRLDAFIPLAELTRAFVRPKSPIERQLAYCQSEMVIDYIREKHGEQAILKMLDIAREGSPLNVAVRKVTGQSLEAFEQAYLKRFKAIAAELRIRPVFLPDDAGTLRERVRKKPGDAAVLCDLGHWQISAGKLDDARKTAERALKLDPKSAWARVIIATAMQLQDKDDTEAATKLLDRAIADDPRNASAWFLLGRLRNEANDASGAAEALERALEIYPAAADTYGMLADIYGKLGKPKEREAALERWIRMDPHDAEPGKKLLETCFEKKRWADAERIARHLIHIIPSEAGVHAKLGRAFVKLSRNPDAARELAVAFKLGTTDGEACAELARLRASGAKPEQAVPPARRAIECNVAVDEMKAIIEKAGTQ